VVAEDVGARDRVAAEVDRMRELQHHLHEAEEDDADEV
jgi:hypothetical protein